MAPSLASSCPRTQASCTTWSEPENPSSRPAGSPLPTSRATATISAWDTRSLTRPSFRRGSTGSPGPSRTRAAPIALRGTRHHAASVWTAVGQTDPPLPAECHPYQQPDRHPYAPKRSAKAKPRQPRDARAGATHGMPSVRTVLPFAPSVGIENSICTYCAVSTALPTNSLRGVRQTNGRRYPSMPCEHADLRLPDPIPPILARQLGGSMCPQYPDGPEPGRGCPGQCGAITESGRGCPASTK